MTPTNLIDLNTFRKRKSRTRVFEALDRFHQEILLPMEQEGLDITPEELEEFLVQVLGDHLVGKLNSARDFHVLDENYHRFDSHLRKCLQAKLRSLAHFESVKRK